MDQQELNLRPKWHPTRRCISLAPAGASMLVTGLPLHSTTHLTCCRYAPRTPAGAAEFPHGLLSENFPDQG